MTKDALGADAHGRPYGGGRSRAGGFEIPIDFLASDDGDGSAEQQQMKWRLYDRQIRRKLLGASGLMEIAHPEG